MKRCWVHVGMHKTGSSSVQQNLARITDSPDWRLLAVGGRPNMGPALHAMFREDPDKCHWFSKSGASADAVKEKGAMWLEELRREITNLKVETCIISAEGLSTFSRAGVIALRDFLLPLFDEVRVIGYVRPPVGFKTSRFQENVKHGNGRFNVAEIRLHYRSKFKKFDDAFGRENVILRKFDPVAFPNQCTVSDFCEQTGIKFPDTVPIVRINESLSREGCGLLYAYRKFGSGYGVGENVIKENLKLVKPLLAVKGAKFKVSMKLLNDALEQERPDISWMEKRLGVSLAESVSQNSSDVTSEQDLLTIRRATCVEFAERFKEIYGEEIPADWLPAADPVDPKQVADLLEKSRGICRNKIHEKNERIAAAKAGREKVSLSKRIARLRNRILGRVPH